MSKNLSNIINAMSVDVEDYFQVSAFEQKINRDNWNKIPCRVEKNVERILTLFENKNITATFFTLGWIAERYPHLIKQITSAGHELASHGWNHARVCTQTRKQFKEDIRSSRKLLEDISGVQVKGYRAPSYSISRENLWALDELAEAGYQYSSSIAPVRHDLYGIPDAPRFPFKVAKGALLEIPISTVKVGGKNLHCSGGGWFRLFPYALSHWAISRVNHKERQPCVFYFHPWEIDPQQPKVSGLNVKSRFRHYLNLSRMESRLTHLLDDFEWGRVDEVFLGIEESAYQQTTEQWMDYHDFANS